MSLVDEMTADIERMSKLSMVNGFFIGWLNVHDFNAEKLTDAELNELLKSILNVTSYFMDDEDDAE